MNKSDLAIALAKSCNLSTKQAENLIVAFAETIEEALVRGEKIVYSNFGTFYKVHYPSKTIQHPRLGAAKKMVMLATDAVKWMPSGNIKEMVKKEVVMENPTAHGAKKGQIEEPAKIEQFSSAEPITVEKKTASGVFDYVSVHDDIPIKVSHQAKSKLENIESSFDAEGSKDEDVSAEESVEIPVKINGKKKLSVPIDSAPEGIKNDEPEKIIESEPKEKIIEKSTTHKIIPNAEVKVDEDLEEKPKLFVESTSDGGNEISTFSDAIRVKKKSSFLGRLFGKEEDAIDEDAETPKTLTDGEKVSLIDAGVFDHKTQAGNEKIYAENKEQVEKLASELDAAQKSDLGSFVSFDKSHQDISYVDLSQMTISKDLLSLIPESVARKYKAVPMEKEGNKLVVAMIDPEDIEAREIIKNHTKTEIIVRLATESDVNHVLDQYSSLESEVKEAIDVVDAEIEENSEETDQANIAVESASNNAPAARIVTSLLRRAIREKASDIHIEPSEDKVEVRFRIDGVLQKKIELPTDVQMAVISRIKILCNMKIDEQRLPQDGRFSIDIDNRKVDFRVSTMPVAFGEKIVMRILDKVSGILTIEQLGLSETAAEILKNNLEKTHGMILVTGPTGSGKTTTLYALIDRLYTEGVNIITLEDPIEYRMPGINQSQVNHDIDYTFASGLRSIVRQDPDIIMIGEIRDGETADMAIHAALTGHIVLSTLHTNNSAGAAPRLVDMGVEPFLITSTINIIIGQRLARKICDKCREEMKIPETEIVKVKAEIAKMPPAEKKKYSADKLKFFHGKGCKFCGDTGYISRAGLYEILPISDEIAKLILDKKTSSDIEKLAIEQGMTTMLQDGIIKALNGLTTLEEVWRVTKD